MRTRSTLDRWLAGVLVVALQVVLVPATAATSTAALNGSVLSGGASVPLPGARVHAAETRTGAVSTSSITTADGSFRLDGLPPATYSLAVESAGGLYLVGTPVHLEPGEERTVHLAVQETAPSPAEAAAKTAGRLAWWNNPLFATLVVLGGAVIVGVIVNNAINDEATASPSSP